jgi:hypothetical protein
VEIGAAVGNELDALASTPPVLSHEVASEGSATPRLAIHTVNDYICPFSQPLLDKIEDILSNFWIVIKQDTIIIVSPRKRQILNAAFRPHIGDFLTAAVDHIGELLVAEEVVVLI